jgi:hypothetical protein
VYLLKLPRMLDWTITSCIRSIKLLTNINVKTQLISTVPSFPLVHVLC